LCQITLITFLIERIRIIRIKILLVHLTRNLNLPIIIASGHSLGLRLGLRLGTGNLLYADLAVDTLRQVLLQLSPRISTLAVVAVRAAT
jgi:hypothetical protein